MPKKPKQHMPLGYKARQQPTRGSSTARGYDGRWEKARKIFLAANTLCKVCQAAGDTVVASVVDHIQPHRGDMVLFWKESNWQPLCRRCHNRKTAKGE